MLATRVVVVEVELFVMGKVEVPASVWSVPERVPMVRKEDCRQD